MAIAKSKWQGIGDETLGPIIPMPSAKVRPWLLGGLWAWQVAIFWLEPALVYFYDPRIQQILDLPLQIGDIQIGQFGSNIAVGVTVAVAANLAFFGAKLPISWISRLMLVGSSLSAALMGSLATFSDSEWIDLNGAHSVMLGVLVFGSVTLGWIFFPGLRFAKLCAVDEGGLTVLPSSQFRLIHLFYLISVTAIVLALVQLMPTDGDISQILHEPIELALVFSFVTLMFSSLCGVVQYTSLGGQRRFAWLGFAALITPFASAVTSFVVISVTGGQLDADSILMLLVIFASMFVFVGGTVLALRLIGYRLT